MSCFAIHGAAPMAAARMIAVATPWLETAHCTLHTENRTSKTSSLLPSVQTLRQVNHPSVFVVAFNLEEFREHGLATVDTNLH